MSQLILVTFSYRRLGYLSEFGGIVGDDLSEALVGTWL